MQIILPNDQHKSAPLGRSKSFTSMVAISFTMFIQEPSVDRILNFLVNILAREAIKSIVEDELISTEKYSQLYVDS